MKSTSPPVVLFRYESSTFTLKVRLALRIKQIPYTFVTVPSMMPRPVLSDNFHLTYRKIPVLAIGRELYCDTSLIIEALEHIFSNGYPSLYPIAEDGRNYRPLIRGFASYWTDRPLFRVTTGLIPASVWRTSFGQDRAGLIGHKLDPDKLEAKVPRNMANFDMQLSLLEPLFQQPGSWIFSTKTPSLADISLYYQIKWGSDIAKGQFLSNLTAGGIPDTNTEGVSAILSQERYPSLYRWYNSFQQFIDALPSTETPAKSEEEVIHKMRIYQHHTLIPPLVPTPTSAHQDLHQKIGLVSGASVAVTPDDTGRDNPTIGTLVSLSPEEVVIVPMPLARPPSVDVRIHFPRIGFVVQPVTKAKL